MNQDLTMTTNMSSGAANCVASIITLSGGFSMFDPQQQNLYMNTSTGVTVINGCLEQLVTSMLALNAQQILTSSTKPGPFWATPTPLIFVVGVTVGLAYILFLISIMSKTRRPWLQRCSTLSVVVSLTLAAVLMWQELKRQHSSMISTDDNDRVKNIRANTALKVLRIISNSLLWLAQVQVLIRTFPRHIDKVIIKWTGLCLIVLQTVFAILNDFVHPSSVNPNSTNSLIPAIPVLDYLFHIALGALYAVCVLVFSCTSRRWRYAYTFRNLPYALASIVSICCPVIFFCLDIWNEQVNGWGDYVRWASSAAASVIVWDWVDQIEANVHKCSKSGVLGREVFEDEMSVGKQRTSKFEHRTAGGGKKILTHLRQIIPHGPTRRISANYEIELPIIHHPLSRDHQSSSTHSSVHKPLEAQDSVNTVSSSSSENIPHGFDTALQGRQIPRIQRFNTTYDYPRNAIIDVGSSAGQGLTTQRMQNPGFVEGDYWMDEKFDTT